ncbi:MAG: PKD domain-containing protein [Candidatus Thermoplasmatota archaeon]|nr:PKD domain-containing protein [Candidatus Thermoplasmatota archaeon]
MRIGAVMLAFLLPLAGCIDLLDSDNGGGSNQPPLQPQIVRPTPGEMLEAGVEFQMVGAGTDPDGDALAYLWTLEGLGEPRELGREAIASATIEQAATDLRLVLTVSDPHGASQSNFMLVTINPANRPPTAAIRLPASGGAYSEGEPVQFDGSLSSDPDLDSLNYHWELGPAGAAQSQVSTEVSFSQSLGDGEYAVTLTVSDERGGEDSVSHQFSVSDLPPVARISADTTTVFIGDSIQFDGSGSDDPEGDLRGYEWDFDDGDTSTLQSPSHTWDDVGSYQVQLTVSDGGGQQGSATLPIEVRSLGPEASFRILLDGNEISEGRAGTELTLDASASSSPNGAITNYSWDFGDGNSNTGSNDTVQYNWTTGGWRNITLTVTDEMDESSDAILLLRVIPQDYEVDYSNGQAIIISNTEDEEQFPVEIFLEDLDLNLTVESNSGSFSYTIYVLDSDGDELWSDEGSLSGGDDASHTVALDTGTIGNVTGDYVIRIEIEREGLSPASASWDFQGWVRYT